MTRSVLINSVAATVCLFLATPVLAATSTTTDVKSAGQCLTDLATFHTQMRRDGNWLGGDGYGYGYPMMGGYGYEYPVNGGGMAPQTGYTGVRPGYDVRILLVAANILARNGQQQTCEDVLATTRSRYKIYTANMKNGEANVPDWQQKQVAAATPVTGMGTSFRSDQLIGTEVRNAQGEPLGSVDDMVLSPQTGKIAYLVIARGGVFGIDEKYVPVPWADFKSTPSASLLVLDTTKAIMEASPQVSHEQFAIAGQFDVESQKVDTYWKAHL
jgi:sporulation protein YlmC with PRC-barrel domain